MAAQGYIGRAPGESSVVVARQTFTPTGITTNFTFASGYTVGYVDAYLNGARLVEGDDYTATDGSVVGLTTHAINGDVLELVVYKAFNATNVQAAKDDFSVGGDATITGTLTVGGVEVQPGAAGTWASYDTNTGISTTKKVKIENNLEVTGAASTFSGNLNVGGVLTYDDVTNVDSIGIITARSHVSIADSILHTGDTDTSIRFPAADTFTVETAGSERIRIRSNGVIIKGNSGTQETVGNGANTQLIGSGSADASLALIRQAAGGGEFYFAAGTSGTNISNNNGLGFIKFMGYHTNGYDEYARIEAFVDGTNGDGDAPGRLIFKTSADSSASPTERLRITAAGVVRIPDGGKLSCGTSDDFCLLYTSPSPRDAHESRMPSSA